jgi:hypothetical protein
VNIRVLNFFSVEILSGMECGMRKNSWNGNGMKFVESLWNGIQIFKILDHYFKLLKVLKYL